MKKAVLTESTPLAARFEQGEKPLSKRREAWEGYRLTSPTAVIGIRGTYFEVQVDDLGETLVVLLRDLDGTVGELSNRKPSRPASNPIPGQSGHANYRSKRIPPVRRR